MQIAKDTVVSIDFSMHDSDGELLDTTGSRDPIAYLHGHGNILPGLEEALEGRSEGDRFTVEVPPEKGYGQRYEELVQTAPLSMFPEGEPPEPGMRYEAETASGPTVITVTEIKDDEVTVDANSPLAGEELHFEVTVTGVREATEAELDNGDVLDED